MELVGGGVAAAAAAWAGGAGRGGGRRVGKRELWPGMPGAGEVPQASEAAIALMMQVPCLSRVP